MFCHRITSCDLFSTQPTNISIGINTKVLFSANYSRFSVMNLLKVIFDSKPQFHIHLSTYSSPGRFAYLISSVKYRNIQYRHNTHKFKLTYYEILWLGQREIWSGVVVVDPSTCFTGSSLVPVDQGGNVFKCSESRFTTANAYYVQTPLREKGSSEREVAVCL